MTQNIKAEVVKLKQIIEKQKHKIEQLSETEQVLKNFVDVIAGIHWWKDKNGVYQGCNHAMVEALGLNTKSDIIGKTDYDLPWFERFE